MNKLNSINGRLYFLKPSYGQQYYYDLQLSTTDIVYAFQEMMNVIQQEQKEKAKQYVQQRLQREKERIRDFELIREKISQKKYLFKDGINKLKDPFVRQIANFYQQALHKINKKYGFWEGVTDIINDKSFTVITDYLPQGHFTSYYEDMERKKIINKQYQVLVSDYLQFNKVKQSLKQMLGNKYKQDKTKKLISQQLADICSQIQSTIREKGNQIHRNMGRQGTLQKLTFQALFSLISLEPNQTRKYKEKYCESSMISGIEKNLQRVARMNVDQFINQFGRLTSIKGGQWKNDSKKNVIYKTVQTTLDQVEEMLQIPYGESLFAYINKLKVLKSQEASRAIQIQNLQKELQKYSIDQSDIQKMEEQVKELEKKLEVQIQKLAKESKQNELLLREKQRRLQQEVNTMAKALEQRKNEEESAKRENNKLQQEIENLKEEIKNNQKTQKILRQQIQSMNKGIPKRRSEKKQQQNESLAKKKSSCKQEGIQNKNVSEIKTEEAKKKSSCEGEGNQNQNVSEIKTEEAKKKSQCEGEGNQNQNASEMEQCGGQDKQKCQHDSQKTIKELRERIARLQATIKELNQVQKTSGAQKSHAGMQIIKDQNSKNHITNYQMNDQQQKLSSFLQLLEQKLKISNSSEFNKLYNEVEKKLDRLIKFEQQTIMSSDQQNFVFTKIEKFFDIKLKYIVCLTKSGKHELPLRMRLLRRPQNLIVFRIKETQNVVACYSSMSYCGTLDMRSHSGGLLMEVKQKRCFPLKKGKNPVTPDEQSIIFGNGQVVLDSEKLEIESYETSDAYDLRKVTLQDIFDSKNLANIKIQEYAVYQVYFEEQEEIRNVEKAKKGQKWYMSPPKNKQISPPKHPHLSEQQINQIKKQVEKLKIMLQQKEKSIKDLSAKNQISKIQKMQLKKAQQKVISLEDQLTLEKEKLEKLKKEVQKQRKEVALNSREVAGLRNKSNTIDQFKEQLKIQKQKVLQLTKEIDFKNKQVIDQRNQISKLREQLKTESSKILNLSDQLATIRQQIKIKNNVIGIFFWFFLILFLPKTVNAETVKFFEPRQFQFIIL